MLLQPKVPQQLLKTSIKLTGLLIILISLVVFLPTLAQDDQSWYYIEKNLLQEARDKKSVDALNQFMLEHPDTVWMGNAIYHRDKAALDEARSTGTVDSIQSFIQQYPDSVWIDSAIYARDKAAYKVAKKTNTKAEYEKFIKNYPNSQWTDKVRKKLNAIKKPKVLTEVKTKPVIISSEKNPLYQPTLPQQRVSRALQIYREIEQKRQLDIKQKQLEEKEKHRKEKLVLAKISNCNKVKDRLKRHEEGVIFYRLDEKGGRVYLTNEEVAKKRESLEMNYSKHCSD